jgi:hypothetical protein
VTWSTVYLPAAVTEPLTKTRPRPFSDQQTLVAILRRFAAQPLPVRLETARYHLTAGAAEPDAAVNAGF